MITSIHERITPEIATAYLARNRKNNRKLSMSVVTSYANDMRDGRWDSENGTSIKFNTDGELEDGQHRLMACIQAGVPFETIVMYGVRKGAINTIDNGRSRSAGAVFTINDIPNANNAASIVRSYIGLKSRRVIVAGTEQGVQYGKISNSIVLEVYRRHQDFFKASVTLSQRCYDSCRAFTISTLGSIYAYLVLDGGYTDEYVTDFIEQLTDCKPYEWNVLRECRKKFVEDKMSNVHMTGSVKQSLLIKAWNYYVRKKDVGIGKFCYNNKFDKDIWFIINK